MNTLPSDITSAEASVSKHVVIIGGGITGLSAGWYLQKKAVQRGLALTYTILEHSNRWGGKIRTEQIDNIGDAPFILEAGPDALLTRKPWALELAGELGLSERILPVNAKCSRTFVLHKGQPVPLPDGLQLLVPTQLVPFLSSPLFSLRGKLRVGLDLLISPRRANTDETLANFVRRRLGAEILDKLGEPLLAGVYNGDPERQSMLATFPQFLTLEKQYGSLIRGMLATQGVRANSKDKEPPFIAFKIGMIELVSTLVEKLNGSLRLNAGVNGIKRLANNRYRVIVTGGSEIDADGIILTAPAPVTSKLLREIAPEAADHLRTIPYAGIGTAYFAFQQEDVPHPLKGFGLVVPGSERRQIDGITWTSSKWNCRAPSGYVLLRVFFGGPRTRGTLQLNDSDLLSIIRAEFQKILGISAPPLFYRIYRWNEGYPQYNLEHLECVSTAEAALPSRIFVAGSAYRGVGVPDCIRQGRDAAIQLIGALVQVREVS
jgi:protoporphyrinogen/coproporphyrinogen III oxidase